MGAFSLASWHQAGNMKIDATCSELEHLVLAMVARGVVSGYAMRKSMDRMRGGRWSTESGSIYRALKRLESAHLIEQRGKAGAPNRQRTEYQLTPAGQAELNRWMHEAIHPDEVERLDDPVRSRSYFLGLVPDQDQPQIVRSWISGTRNLIDSIKYDLERANSMSSRAESIALGGYLAVAEARLKWLEELETTVSK